MATEQEKAAIGTLQAVLNLYGAEAYAPIATAFEDALLEPDDDRRSKRLADNLLDIIRERSGASLA